MTRYQAELYHHGIKGQKWGVRRFQNPDGTLTEEGRRRYFKEMEKTNRVLADYVKNAPHIRTRLKITKCLTET